MQMCPKTFVTLLVTPHLALVKILTGEFTHKYFAAFRRFFVCFADI